MNHENHIFRATTTAAKAQSVRFSSTAQRTQVQFLGYLGIVLQNLNLQQNHSEISNSFKNSLILKNKLVLLLKNKYIYNLVFFIDVN